MGRHEKLPIARFGGYSRTEVAIIGSPCGLIRQFAEEIAADLGPVLAAYVDAAHEGEVPESSSQSPFCGEWQQRGEAFRLLTKRPFGKADFRLMWRHIDLALVNGNHFQSEDQIIVLHSDKLESLSRKLARITRPMACILHPTVPNLPPFLAEHFEKLAAPVQVISWENRKSVIAVVKSLMPKPPLKGLVLAGGKSLRMGIDKTRLDFHGKPQREYLLNMVGDLLGNAYLSCRQDQENSDPGPHTLLVDKIVGIGPMGAILSAFLTDPDAAWLVLASDLPLMDRENLEILISERNTGVMATAFQSPTNGDPEPLAAIWEPRAFPYLLSQLSLGQTCPRRALLQEEISLVQPIRPETLLNINTPEDYQLALDYLQKH